MAHSSHTKSSISIDLFNLPPLPDARRQTTMFCEIPNDFFLPDRKSSRLSQIINTWTFGRLTPDGNKGVGVKIGFLEHAYGTKYYVIDQVNGDINVIHDDRIELTEFTGCFSPFNLDELEMKVCRLADCQEDENDLPKGTSTTQTHQAQESDSNSGLQSIEDLTGMGFNSPNYSPIPPVTDQNRDSHHQTRFDERFNRQYLPNYNNFQPSPIGPITRSRFECHIDRIGHHTVKIIGNHGSQPEESARSLQH